jgi:hypothetical protein
VTLRHFCLAFLAAIVYVVVCNSSLLAQTQTQHPAQSEAVQLWNITFRDQADLNRLAGELDIWEVDHAAHSLLAPLTADEANALSQTHTLSLAPDQSQLAPPTVSASQASGIPAYACYRTVEESFASLDQLALDYPHLVKQVDIGDSWDKANAGGSPGDDMRVLVISNRAIPGPKFRFFLMGAIHAREYATAELALRFAESLLQGYGSDANATWLLDHGELHLLTFANPDGRRIAETGQLWRKNTDTIDAACSIVSLPAVGYGVDLNRNSSFKWAGCEGFNCSSAISCRETYHGIAPASEPEVAAIEAYLRSIFPDQRGETLQDAAPTTTPGLMLSLHSYGQLVLFPWGWTTTHAPNGYGLATIARHFGYPLNYTVCQAGGVGCLYQTDGTTDDFAYGELGVASFTIELGTDFFQSCSYFEDSILQPGLTALRYAFSAAPQPYVLAEGPDVINLAAMPQAIGPATHVAVTATADASRMAALSGYDVDPITEPTDPVQGARLTIDQLPWTQSSFAYPFLAVDGAFNTVQEAISTTVEIACLPSGRHTLYAQAQDEQGDWGVVSAAFVTVTNTSPFTATVQSAQADTKEDQPITYTVHLTNTGITTTTYRVEITVGKSGAADVTVEPSQPITLIAGASIHLTVVVTPQNNTASTTLPTVIVIRSDLHSTQCRQLQVTTRVDRWNYQQRLLIIRKP